MATTKNTFKDIGFLSNECVMRQQAQELKLSDCYQICCNLNQLAQSVLNLTTIHTDDRKEVYAMVYFERMLIHYQGILLLAERGMVHQVEILLSALLEALFTLAAFEQNEEFFDAFVLGEHSEKLAFLKKLREQQRTLATYTEEELTELERIIASSDNIDRDDFRLFIKADLAGMLNEYRTLYPLLGESVHSMVHSLKQDLVFNPKNNEIDDINVWNKNLDEMYPLLMSAANYMLKGLNSIMQLVSNVKGDGDVKVIEDKIQGEWQHFVLAVSHR